MLTSDLDLLGDLNRGINLDAECSFLRAFGYRLARMTQSGFREVEPLNGIMSQGWSPAA